MLYIVRKSRHIPLHQAHRPIRISHTDTRPTCVRRAIDVYNLGCAAPRPRLSGRTHVNRNAGPSGAPTSTHLGPKSSSTCAAPSRSRRRKPTHAVTHDATPPSTHARGRTGHKVHTTRAQCTQPRLQPQSAPRVMLLTPIAHEPCTAAHAATASPFTHQNLHLNIRQPPWCALCAPSVSVQWHACPGKPDDVPRGWGGGAPVDEEEKGKVQRGERRRALLPRGF